MTEVYLALGSNIGDSAANIAQATTLLASKVHNISQAPTYQTKPVGYTDQPDFLNTAIRGVTDLSPEDLLVFIKDVEQKVGRVERFRWGPREIDIDIIFYGDQVVELPDLIIPHARFRERDFVLRPLQDLNPEKIDPVSHQSVKQLSEALVNSISS